MGISVRLVAQRLNFQCNIDLTMIRKSAILQANLCAMGEKIIVRRAEEIAPFIVEILEWERAMDAKE